MADENVPAPAPTRSDNQITPIDQAYHFVSPPSGDAIMDFVNELGYTEARLLAIQTFLTDKAILGSPTKKGRKDKPCVIPYCRFTKLIIYHLVKTHNIHQRLASPFHLAEEYLRLGNLKFVPKGEEDEVFGMPIPNELISNNIRNTPYYDAYLEMVAKHEQKIAAEQGGKKKPVTAKQPKPKPAKEKTSKPAPAPKAKRRTPATEEASTGPSPQPQDDTSANIVCDSPSPVNAKTSVDTDNTNNGEKTAEIDEGQAGSDPGKTPESRPLPEQVFMNEDQAGPDPGESRVALAGPDPDPTHDEFIANVYPNVHESLKFPADEHVILEDPLSSTGTLSSMKNLDDAFTIRDQFINDKSTEDELEKLNVEVKVVSMYPLPLNMYPHKNLDNTTQNLGSRVFTFELRDLPYKIDKTVRETVKEAVYVALQALLRDRFRDLPEADMK
ncbi:hypothetical protein Tco_0444752 [Tanacetum coccineum]